MTVPVTLDISRLVSRSLHATPTGIDRVEMAYVAHLLNITDRDVRFECWFRGVGYRALSRRQVVRFIDATNNKWNGTGKTRTDWLKALAQSSRAETELPGHYLVPSHQNLDVQARLLSRRAAAQKLFVFLHDTIPSDYPEYARPGGAEKHRRRISNAITLAHGLIVNSAATADALLPYCAAEGRIPPISVAPLGVDAVLPSPDQLQRDRPYFLCLATIEPRKNHLLLLHIWRHMAQSLDSRTLPRLIMVGRRGWENENVVDLLDRCAALDGLIEEHGRVSDTALLPLMRGARALLMPSFAEGYGLPVAEALAAGTPVIASDISAFRESGGDVPDYLDPLDGPGWTRAILDYAASPSLRRAAQLDRLGGWKRPDWDTHFKTVFDFMDGLT